MTGRRLSLFILLIAVICFASPVFAARKKSAPQKKSVIPVEMDYAALFGKVLPSVVRITTDRSAGSGFFVSDKGEILTNYHIVNGAGEIFVTTSEGLTAKALVKGADENGDMALLVIDAGKNTPYLNISKTLPKQGEAVMAAGNPQGFEGTVSNGIISAFRQNKRWLQFTAPVSPDSSGGVLVNSRGEVVGMPTLQYTEGQNLNFAIALNILRKILENARKVPVARKAPIQNNSGSALYEAAELGNPQAQCELGLEYEQLGDYPKALYWYLKSAEQGDAGGQNQLGNFYADGRGIPQNFEVAVYWYRKAAEQGLAVAQSNLGNNYYYGLGIKRDLTQAIYWLRKSAEQGYSQAQNNLGIIYANGIGTQQDFDKAIYWWRKAAKQGELEAQRGLAQLGIYDY